MMDNKPEGHWRCRACGRSWEGSELRLSVFHPGTVWTCWDVFCGGTCDRVAEEFLEGKNAETRMSGKAEGAEEVGG